MAAFGLCGDRPSSWGPLLSRLVHFAFAVLLTFVFVRFLVWQLPGGMVDFLSDAESSLIDLKELSKELETEYPFWASFGDFFQLNWGRSALYSENSLSVIVRYLPVTLGLAASSMIFTLFFAAAYFCMRTPRALLISSFVLSIPAIALYPLIVFALCEWGPACPAGSMEHLQSFFWAATAQGFLAAPRFYREMAWEIDEYRRRRFVLVLRAKGLSRFAIWSKHIAKNLMAPFCSLFILTLLSFVSGAVLVESLFDLPGLGLLLLEAIRARDLSLLLPLVLFLSYLHFFLLRSMSFSTFTSRFSDKVRIS